MLDERGVRGVQRPVRRIEWNVDRLCGERVRLRERADEQRRRGE
jgi:hypothetical protein